jgi:two-component system, NarL family, sensor histidine kinase UhpB
VKPGLETRLNLSIACIILLIIGLTFVWAIRDARLSIRQEASASVGLALGLIDAAWVSGEMRPAYVHLWLDRVAHIEKIRHLRIRAIPWSDSSSNAPSLASSPSPTGVPGWFRWAVASQPMEVIRELKVAGDDPMHIVIQSNAEDEIQEAWNETKGFMTLILLMALTIYLAVHWVVGRALRPVNQMVEGLNAIEAGNFDHRIEVSGLPEMDRISQGINHLSETLKASRDENRALTRHSRELVEKERQSISRELHDELGQSLSLIKFSASTLKRKGVFEGEDALVQITKTCDHLFGVIRDMVRRLRPSALDELGLLASLEDLVENWRTSRPGVFIHLSCAEGVDAVAEEASIDLLRIVQECLSNIARHADATRIDIHLELGVSSGEDPLIMLTVSDDGCGFDPMIAVQGFGLKGIRERAESLKGRCQIESSPGSGTRIHIELPGGIQS